MTKRLKAYILALMMLASYCLSVPVYASKNQIFIEAEEATEVTDPLIRT